MKFEEDTKQVVIDAFTQLAQEYSDRLTNFESNSLDENVGYLFGYLESSARSLLEIVSSDKERDYIRDLVAAAGEAWLRACMTKTPGNSNDRLPRAISYVTGAFERLGIGLP